MAANVPCSETPPLVPGGTRLQLVSTRVITSSHYLVSIVSRGDRADLTRPRVGSAAREVAQVRAAQQRRATPAPAEAQRRVVPLGFGRVALETEVPNIFVNLV
jgi:hypothetical protein